MAVKDILLAIVVVAVWGVNFVLIRVGLGQIPPLALCTLRFFFVFFPWIFFIPRPKVPLKYLVGYGLCYFALQFSLLFSAMHVGFPAGLSSLMLQIQVFFTIGLSAIFFNDRPGARKLLGALLAFSGVALVGLRSPAEVTPLSLTLMLGAALCFAMGNMVSKKMGKTEPLPIVVWGSLIAFPVISLASFFWEGPTALVYAVQTLSWESLGAILYIAYLSTLVGFALWNILLSRYLPSTVAPFTLLVPLFGFISSAIFLGERFGKLKILASLLIVTGLAISQFSTRRTRRE